MNTINGNITITEPGSLLSRWTITGTVRIAAPGVTIDGCHLLGRPSRWARFKALWRG